MNLTLHKLRLAVHKRLGDHIDILRLHELLSHLVEECVHFVIRDLLQLRLMVLQGMSHISLVRAEVLIEDLGTSRFVNLVKLHHGLVIVDLFIRLYCHLLWLCQ